MKIEYKNKKRISEHLGLSAKYMDHRKTHLYCKYPLVPKGGQTLKNLIEHFEETCKKFGYSYKIEKSYYNCYWGASHIGIVRVPFDETGEIQAGSHVVYIPAYGESRYGVVKSLTGEGHAFVWYHSGCTASRTNLDELILVKKKNNKYRVHTGCEECQY